MSTRVLTTDEKRVLRNAVRRSKLKVGDHVYTTKGCRIDGPSEGYILGFTMYSNSLGNFPGAKVNKDRLSDAYHAHSVCVYKLDNLKFGFLKP